MGLIEKSNNNYCWQGCREIGTHFVSVGVSNVETTLDGSLQVS